jgi:DNA-binding winged helix-turn-helix (wHTH) protein
VHCSCREKNFALFATPEGVRRIDHDHFKRTPEVQAAIETYDNAALLRAAADSNHKALFEQSHCSIFPGEKNEPSAVFVFAPIKRADGKGQIGFAGMTLKPRYIRERLLPQAISELLRGNGDDSAPIISVLDENDREVYSSGSGLTRYEIRLPLSPVFRQWKMAIGYRNTTIEELARRQSKQETESGTYRFGEIEINFTGHQAFRKGKQLELSAREFELLKYFIAHRGETITRDQLLDEVWGYDNFPLTRTVDNHIARLRQKIEKNPTEPQYIITVHRVGYKFLG